MSVVIASHLELRPTVGLPASPAPEPAVALYNDRMTRYDLKESLVRAFNEVDHNIVCAYLYGSHARGDARPTSDVDVAVLFTEPQPATLDGLRFDLMSILEDHVATPVDLLVLNAAPVDLVHRVLRDGVLVCERDRAARIRFEVRSRNDYFDLLPILERYRHGAQGRAA